MQSVLVLNADYSLLDVVSWQQAVSMLVTKKVRLVQEYVGRVLRSASATMPFPAVVVRTSYIRPQRKIRFSRKNILARDAYACQYCGAQPRRTSGLPDLEALTIDHVVPRAQSQGGWVTLPWSGARVRVTSWENVLTACSPCNGAKADRTPQQAGMTPRKFPRTPSGFDLVSMSVFRYEIPEEWKMYLPEGSPWRDYWEAELVSD